MAAGGRPAGASSLSAAAHLSKRAWLMLTWEPGRPAELISRSRMDELGERALTAAGARSAWRSSDGPGKCDGCRTRRAWYLGAVQ